ncbi:hypothetical protein GCM10023237_02180 [Streptomyces coeruleoprunus]
MTPLTAARHLWRRAAARGARTRIARHGEFPLPTRDGCRSGSDSRGSRRVWGSTTVVAHGTVHNAAALPALLAEQDGGVVGLLTYTTSDHIDL